MSEADWGLLSPEMVSEWINFNGGQKDWHYSAQDRQSMPAKQTEGVAYLWNLLAEQKVALLADEVGMGKTFQALGVAALLWKMKPDARILVMAPNRDLCLHWRREFNNLVASHYRVVDHTVKNSVDGGPVPSVEICKSLADLNAAVMRGVSHFYLTTIHSLSGLLRGEELDNRRPDKIAGERAGEIHKSIKSALGPEGFDLIIVDEAHYLRNIDGGSQRVAAAKEFFGTRQDPLSQRVLLLTATPSHTRLSNVNSIFSYFLDCGDGWTSESDRASHLLNNYGLRRMRLMEGNGKLFSKRHYRHEKPVPATFVGQPEAEGFFALYQKGLVAELNKKNENKSLMYGYLEGFESVGRDVLADEVFRQDSERDTPDGENGKSDYSTAPDTNLLMGLTDSFYRTFNRFPGHPKYGRLIEECVPEKQDLYQLPLSNLKHLIFVRRIPSVRELTQRLNERYDQLLGEILFSGLGLSFLDTQGNPRLKTFSRNEFEQLLESTRAGVSQDESIEMDAEDGDSDGIEDDYLASRIAQLFVVKRGGAGGQTDCANVRLRFTKPESLFSLFLEPSSDYLKGGYNYFYGDSERTRANYGLAARYERFGSWNSAADLREAVGENEAPKTAYIQEMFTVWRLVFDELPSKLQELMRGWANTKKPVAENFANYIQAGFLHASPVIVELYSWFVEYRRKGKIDSVQERYRGFYEFVRQEKIKGSLLLRYFVAALETFEALCDKIVDHRAGDWRKEWRSLKGLTSPAWYASGENNTARQRLILGFNSPFYPNVLVSTSVFQEGVNLHMNCHQVHHYGIAGSPGDNEQRVGRIDRLYGCVNKRLATGGGELGIHYPYLAGSVDEDQVASFIERKHRVEERMDACLQSRFDSEYRPSSMVDWGQFLRKPLDHSEELVEDPYPAKFRRLREAGCGYKPQETHTFEDITEKLRNHLERACDPLKDKILEANSSQTSPKPLFVIDPLVERRETKRHQPIFATLGFSPRFSALSPDTAYVVSFSSPIANRANLEKVSLQNLNALISELSKRYPLVRVGIDEDVGNSHFYLSTRVNFPLFVRRGKMEWFSLYEVRMGLESIKQFSDELEAQLFHGRQDLTVAEISSSNISGPKPLPERFMSQRNIKRAEGAWSSVESELGQVEQLIAPLSKEQIHALLDQTAGSAKGADPALNLLRLNSRFPFVNFREKGAGEFEVQLNFPAGDFQDSERALLREWFDYVVGDRQ
ncbi:DEAD/DEAH box helicase [Marinobacter nauticus]|jgi:superfamily II DNA or RNA helicase|uniref:DEAD/DEAH box helicase n=1 Tax=Marinobacter nauticus TaxID=2743 RepID=UPI00241C181E|nr:DEAD/DEAH box helicase [Marinobacter nauticus]